MNNNLGERSANNDSSTHISDLLDDDFDCQYFDVKELQELAVDSSFLVVSQNIRSLGGKFDNFSEYIASFRSPKVSVVALQEVWSVGRIYDLPGYHPIEFNTRDKSRTLNFLRYESQCFFSVLALQNQLHGKTRPGRIF